MLFCKLTGRLLFSAMTLKIVSSSLLLVFYLHCVNSDIFIGSASLVKCTSVCEETFPLASNKIAKSECCSRGCRFYGIAELMGVNKQLELNISSRACHNCCYESYGDRDDKAACNMGCDTMAKHHKEFTGLAAADVSWSFFIEGGEWPEILHAGAGEIPEPDDVLTDPALKRQLALDLEDSKLPEMRVKTLPVNIDEHDKRRGDWWADCSVTRAAVPRCLIASLLVFLILLALWFGLGNEDKISMPSPPILYNSEQAPPLPPKYSLFDDVKV